MISFGTLKYLDPLLKSWKKSLHFINHVIYICDRVT